MYHIIIWQLVKKKAVDPLHLDNRIQIATALGLQLHWDHNCIKMAGIATSLVQSVSNDYV